MTDLTDDYIKRVIAAAPFADNEAGIPQMVELIKALHAQLAGARAAQAMVVDRAAEICEAERLLWQAKAEDKHEPASIRNGFLCRAGGHGADAKAIRALADTDGRALVQALRAERDDAVAKLLESRAVNKRLNTWLDGDTAGLVADRDRLAAANAALEAQVARLVDALRMRGQYFCERCEEVVWGGDHTCPGALAEVQADAQRKGDDA